MVSCSASGVNVALTHGCARFRNRRQSTSDRWGARGISPPNHAIRLGRPDGRLCRTLHAAHRLIGSGLGCLALAGPASPRLGGTLLSGSLVDAALFVESGGSRVPQASRSDGVAGLDAFGAAWTIIGRGRQFSGGPGSICRRLVDRAGTFSDQGQLDVRWLAVASRAAAHGAVGGCRDARVRAGW